MALFSSFNTAKSIDEESYCYFGNLLHVFSCVMLSRYQFNVKRKLHGPIGMLEPDKCREVKQMDD